MSDVVKAAPMVGDRYLIALISRHRADLEKYRDGRPIVRVAVRDGPGGARVLDADLLHGPEVPRLLKGWVEGAKKASDTGQYLFADEVLQRWEGYDREELVFCLVVSGGANWQMRTLPKPWLTNGIPAHAHCACGFRVGADADHDAEHADADLFARLDYVVERAAAAFGRDRSRARVLADHVRRAHEKEPAGRPRDDRLADLVAAWVVCIGADERALERSRATLELAVPPHPRADKIVALALEQVEAYHRGKLEPGSIMEGARLLEESRPRSLVREKKEGARRGRPLYDAETPVTEGEVDTAEAAGRHARIDTFVDWAYVLAGKLAVLTRHPNLYLAVAARGHLSEVEKLLVAPRPGGVNRVLETFARR